MTKHRLSKGVGIIDALASLGEALDYAVEREMPVERNRHHSAAVDVAWLFEKGQSFPLMIFEVESRITNAIANNPVKVFGQPNARFEKPLFFFHILVTGTYNTSRVQNLERLFGTFNYRVYRLGKAGTTRLLKDIFSQHRRLKDELPLGRVIASLSSEHWHGVDLGALLRHIEKIGFVAPFLPTYAKLGIENEKFRDHFARFLDETIKSGRLSDLPDYQSRVLNYATYVGNDWPEPVYCGFLALAFPDRAHEFFQRLQWWQEKSSYMTQIGPHFGSSRDYDNFLLGLAPAFWALIAALMRPVFGAVAYVAEQCGELLKRLGNARVEASFFTAIWLCHIAASCRIDSQFQFAQDFINSRGGIPEGVLYNPPSLVIFDEGHVDEKWRTSLANLRNPVPNSTEFRSEMLKRLASLEDNKPNLPRFALAVLSDDQTIQSWATTILQALYSHS